VKPSELKALAEKCLADYEIHYRTCSYFEFQAEDSVILAKAVLRLQVQLAEEEDKFK